MHENEKNIFEKNLVWVFGTIGSGKNWLASNLSQEMNVLYDTYVSDHIGVSAGQIKNHFVRRKDLRKSANSYFFSDPYKKTWQFYLKELILNRIFAEIKDCNSKVLIKEPATLGASDVISECMPNSKIIIMLRDGRHTIDFLSESRQSDGFVSRIWEEFPTEPKKRLDFIEKRAKLWTDHVLILQKTFENHPKENRLVIEYEDLVHNTLEILERVCDFIQIEVSKEHLESFVNNFKNEYHSKKDWKDRFSPLEIETMNKIMKNIIENNFKEFKNI